MARREDRVKQRLPRIGGLLLRIFDEAPSTKAFKKGADGERVAIKKLLSDSGPNVLFLVNRRLGVGRRDGDVDVVAVSAAGVLVIDVKRYAEANVRVEREGGCSLHVTMCSRCVDVTSPGSSMGWRSRSTP